MFNLTAPHPSAEQHPARVVLVTGASSGIGRATALLLATTGDHVVLAARRAAVLAEVGAECTRLGAASVLVVPTDLDDDAATEQLIARVLERHGRVDAVLHCAGVVAYGRAEELDAATFDDVVRTNLTGSVNVARHSLRAMRARERGVLVLVGSLLGHIAVPDMTPYVVSKWAVRSLARQLRIENADLPDVHISHVAPGSVDTPIYGSALDSAGMVSTPPPPVISAERVAELIVAQLTTPRASVQTALSNYALIAAFTVAPRLYDRLIGPVFNALSRRVEATAEEEPAAAV